MDVYKRWPSDIDVGESTAYAGELTRWRNDLYSKCFRVLLIKSAFSVACKGDIFVDLLDILRKWLNERFTVKKAIFGNLGLKKTIKLNLLTSDGRRR